MSASTLIKKLKLALIPRRTYSEGSDRPSSAAPVISAAAEPHVSGTLQQLSKTEQSSSPHSRRGEVLDDKHEEFLNSDNTHKNGLRNPLNLFDDSNQQDQMWLKVARDYLSKAR